jgi:hypothetical protein
MKWKKKKYQKKYKKYKIKRRKIIMSKLREIMNSQLNLALEEIDALEHGAERTKLRIMLVSALANTATLEFDAPKGKSAIKNDTAKDVAEDEISDEEIEAEEVEGEEDVESELEGGQEVDVEDEGEQEDVFAEDEEGNPINISPAFYSLNLSDYDQRFTVAYYMTVYGLDEVDQWVANFTDNVVTSAVEFLNDENAQGFLDWLASE